jgi:CobQ-like glutamine amidotransferase family enzyme
MSGFVVASLVPRLLDIHGDAQNAQVLATRARWRGVDATVVDVETSADAAAQHPDAITIGAGFDADAPEILAALRSFESELSGWVAAGVPLVAVGLGWELLSASVELAPGEHTPGLGVFPGRAVASERSVGTVAVDSAFGRLVGYEYHLRDYVRSGAEQPLGVVVYGVGNLVAASGGREDGAVIGACVGTGIRGPVLARNPRLADEVLVRAFARRGIGAGAVDPRQDRADAHAETANRIVLENMRIGRNA